MDLNHVTGRITQIQEYALHDGAGIRTTVFMAGCPLRCRWCANPESWAQPGTAMTVGQVVGRVLRSAVFFRASGGGVTFSGGEPGSQPEFLNALTAAFEQMGTDMALETSGFFDWGRNEDALRRMSTLFWDLKHMDGEAHRAATGSDNAVILENLGRAAGLDIPMVVRIPLIPGVNDTGENLGATARFLKANVPCASVEILPYHNFGTGKYKALGLPVPDFSLPGLSDVAAARATVEAEGIRTVDLR